MKLKIIILFWVIVGLLFSCSNNSWVIGEASKDKIKIEEKITILKNKNSSLVNQIYPNSQRFEINANSDFSITGEKGTLIYIPSNSFVDENNRIINGIIEIKIIEILTIADILKSNLQTKSGENLLQSEGMLFIDARSDGKSVSLAPNKKLQIELPKIKNHDITSDVRMFSGTYDKGNINWTEKSKLGKKLIPLPLNLFDYKKWISYNFLRDDNRIMVLADNEEHVDSITFKNKNLENTFIATREFEERYPYIMLAEWAIGRYSSFYSTTAQTGRMVKDSTISNIYLNNLDKNLSYCDSLALDYMKLWKGKAHFGPYVDSDPGSDYLLNIFESFYEKGLTTIIDLPNDINLEDNNIRLELSRNGFSEIEIDEIIGAYKTQERIVSARKNKETAYKISRNSFAVSGLGWINCDSFYEEPNAKESIILASIINSEEYEFAIVNLVINKKRIVLNGNLIKNSVYTFSGKSTSYIKLPIGDKATILVLSYKNGKPYFGIREFRISEKESIEIKLEESSIKKINEKLEKIN